MMDFTFPHARRQRRAHRMVARGRRAGFRQRHPPSDDTECPASRGRGPETSHRPRRATAAESRDCLRPGSPKTSGRCSKNLALRRVGSRGKVFDYCICDHFMPKTDRPVRAGPDPRQAGQVTPPSRASSWRRLPRRSCRPGLRPRRSPVQEISRAVADCLVSEDDEIRHAAFILEWAISSIGSSQQCCRVKPAARKKSCRSQPELPTASARLGSTRSVRTSSPSEEAEGLDAIASVHARQTNPGGSP